ncbi:uncharacterized protein LOC143032535 [Oratosquilla oratoria]|uniref:uncharacterized protein LOC143032535 n=1 Tax=Oratosquilla oratoria TaxID=337810 RepID=UPI003F767014
MASFKTALLLGVLACVTMRGAMDSTATDESFQKHQEQLVANGSTTSEEAPGHLATSSERETSEGHIANHDEEDREKNPPSSVVLENGTNSELEVGHLFEQDLDERVRAGRGWIQALEGLGRSPSENEALFKRLHYLPVFRNQRVKFVGSVTEITNSYQRPSLPCMTQAIFRSENEYMLDIPQPGMPRSPSKCLWVMATPIITSKLKLKCEAYEDRMYNSNIDRDSGRRPPRPSKLSRLFINPSHGNFNPEVCWRKDTLEVYTWSLGQPIR